MLSKNLCRFAVALSMVALPSLAAAQPVGEDVRAARKRFQEGVAAWDAGKFEAARVAFQQAYALKLLPPVLRNLGEAELKTGHYVEAARHLSSFLRDEKAGSPKERQAASASLATAEAKVARLELDVTVAEAEVTVDGDPVGRTPLPREPWYVAPGDHMVRAHKDGYTDATSVVSTEAGQLTRVSLTLVAADAAPSSAPAPAPATASAAAPASAPEPAPVPALAAPPPSDAPAPLEAHATSTRTVVLVAGAALTVVAAGTGVVFAMKASSADGDASDLRARSIAAYGVAGCGTPAGAASATCADLKSALDRRSSDRTVETAAFVSAGVLGAATIATYFLWPRESGSAKAPAAAIAPVVGPSFAGVSARASF